MSPNSRGQHAKILGEITITSLVLFLFFAEITCKNLLVISEVVDNLEYLSLGLLLFLTDCNIRIVTDVCTLVCAVYI